MSINKIKLIKTEIERLQSSTLDENRNFLSSYHEGIFDGLSMIDNFIDSLEEEPISNALEEAAYNFVMNNFGNPKEPPYKFDQRCFKAGAQWQKKHLFDNRIKDCNNITEEQYNLESDFLDDFIDKHDRMPTFLDAIVHGMKLQKEREQSTIELAEDHAMLAGMDKMRQEMMKNVVLETKVMKDSDGDGIDTPYEEWLTLEDTEIPFIPNNIGLKDGDKVKLIIIREE